MEAEEILTRVRTGENVPDSWVIFPLLHRKVLLGIIGWLVGILMGLALLALIVPVVIPYNYQRGVISSIFTTLLLSALLFVTIGSLWLLMSDIRRIQQAEKHMMVITDDVFVKQEGEKILAVPLVSIRHVTPRGRAPAESVEPAIEARPTSSGAILGSMFGGGQNASDGNTRQHRRGMRSPTSLAFIDVRTGREVTVVNDNSYGDPFTIASVLKEYTASVSGAEPVEQQSRVNRKE